MGRHERTADGSGGRREGTGGPSPRGAGVRGKEGGLSWESKARDLLREWDALGSKLQRLYSSHFTDDMVELLREQVWLIETVQKFDHMVQKMNGRLREEPMHGQLEMEMELESPHNG
jgi:hypothetical protein